jgi:HAD superfamily hydrolase (TIGR01509 family)
MTINTVLFDFDGVVIDSEPVHAKAKKMVLEKFRIPYPEIILDEYKGRPDKVFFDFVSRTLDSYRHSSDQLQNEKKAAFDDIVKELRMVDGFLSFLSGVRKRGLKAAMVSSTSLYSLSLVDNLFGISGLFDLVITEVDTLRHKPEPDPYLKALEKLQANSTTSIVIEDSPNGIISAKRAGCFVYGLTGSFQSHILSEAGADVTVESYADLMNKIGF